MRLNKYIALATGLSRRKADDLIANGKVSVNDQPAELGRAVLDRDNVTVNGKSVSLPQTYTYLLINKPSGYVSTRNSQDGTPTVYELVPDKHHNLKYVGRLDKNSSGALLLTNDGDFAHQMTHPSFVKAKTYRVSLDHALQSADLKQLEAGVKLDDGISNLNIAETDGSKCVVEMHEGRNRQIRRTFEKLGYEVTELHRTNFGPYDLGGLKPGEFIEVKKLEV